LTPKIEPGTKILAIVGPTASGKTKVATFIAYRLPCEIVSMDSAKVYKGMDIGTSKLKNEELERHHYHLVNVYDPRENYSVALFKEMAEKAIFDITNRGKTPLLVGGSGLYFRALVDDLDFSNTSDTEQNLRTKLESLSTEELCEILSDKDPKAAAKIPENNRRRLIRAIEIALKGTRLLSEMQTSWKDYSSPYDIKAAGLICEREVLYERIDRRVDEMIKSGFIEEVKRLRRLGLKRGTTAGESLGYRQILDYLDGKLELNKAVSDIKKRTRNLAKRQITWFKKDPRVKWFYVPMRKGMKTEEEGKILENVAKKILEYFQA